MQDGRLLVPQGGRFSQELEEGNIEYKWKLVNTSEERLVHLTTQLNWRLNESETGEAIYLIGVKDDGYPEGISEPELRESLGVLRAMAKGVSAAVKGVKTQKGVAGRLAQVVIRREKYRSTAPLELRVAALGNAESGKSTLVGVLTKGALDNGRGLARMKVFRHNHEVENGRTSSVTQHMLGFSASGDILNYARGSSRLASPASLEEIQHRSAKIVSFIDLAGHEKYLKTTLSGMTGLSPDYAMLSVAATTGAHREEEHGPSTDHYLGIALALNVPLFVVITKVDLASAEALEARVSSITAMVQSAGKDVMVIRTPEDMARLEQATKLLEEKPPQPEEEDDEDEEEAGPGQQLPVPVFLVSNVTGHGLDFLRAFFRRLPRLRVWQDARHDPMEVHIDGSFEVEGVGTVLAGTIHRGRVEIGDSVLLGPDRVTGAFQPAVIRSMHVNRVAVRTGVAGQCVTFALSTPSGSIGSSDGGGGCLSSSPVDAMGGLESMPSPRKKQHVKGTVLLSPSATPCATYEFDAEVVVLSHYPSGGRISVNFEPVVHVHTMRQTAKIVAMDRLEGVGKGETARCRFRLLYHPEYVNAGMQLVFRAGRTLGIGRITSVVARDGRMGGMLPPKLDQDGAAARK